MEEAMKNTFFVIVILCALFLCSCEEKTTEPGGGSASTATVTINLSTSTGASVSGALVRIANNNGNESQIWSRNATSSVVTFTEIPHGTYTLTVTLSGHDTHSNTTLAVNTANVSNSVTLNTMQTATVTVMLSTNDGGTVNNALVRLTNNDGNPAHIYQTNATSHVVVIPNVALGTYTIFVNLTGYISHSNNNLLVNTANISTSVNLVPHQTSVVTITVHTHDDQSVDNAVVKLVNNNQDPSMMYQQGVAGNTAVFDAVVYGTYTITVSLGGYASFVNNVFSVYSSSIDRSYTLQGFQIRGLCPAGGLIFYDKGFFSDGWRYMSAAPVSSEFQAMISSTFQGQLIQAGTGIGDGKINTMLLSNIQNSLGESGTAILLCVSLNINDFSDWFMPSRDELFQMYSNLKSYNLGAFSDVVYLTSTNGIAGANGYFYTLNFANGHSSNIYHNRNARVRAIRQF
jgi:hypothetical protein